MNEAEAEALKDMVYWGAVSDEARQRVRTARDALQKAEAEWKDANRKRHEAMGRLARGGD